MARAGGATHTRSAAPSADPCTLVDEKNWISFASTKETQGDEPGGPQSLNMCGVQDGQSTYIWVNTRSKTAPQLLQETNLCEHFAYGSCCGWRATVSDETHGLAKWLGVRLRTRRHAELRIWHSLSLIALCSSSRTRRLSMLRTCQVVESRFWARHPESAPWSANMAVGRRR